MYLPISNISIHLSTKALPSLPSRSPFRRLSTWASPPASTPAVTLYLNSAVASSPSWLPGTLTGPRRCRNNFLTASQLSSLKVSGLEEREKVL
ncbi:hypothetical protein E2C01_093400 [Portunus trituberculatus]|uniref:Uncharacterized protein n=1 Tax=Portunus trituberculatus TaxID=210409 RepID=A0A5B7JMM7_PORTR|nr:hypothetical protein [Portunus trituberculatus]